MEKFTTQSFGYEDGENIANVEEGQSVSFTEDGYTITGGQILTKEKKNFEEFESRDPIVEKIERTFSPKMKQKNDRDYIDKINRYVKSMFGKNAKTNGKFRERGNPLK